MTELIPLTGILGLKLRSARPERVEGRLTYSPDRCTADGVLHGGALMALTYTSESKTNFFRAVREGYVDSVSRPLQVGRSTIAVQTDLFDANGGHVARTTQTQAVVGGARE